LQKGKGLLQMEYELAKQGKQRVENEFAATAAARWAS